ncbi:MAG: hypothetical protein Kow009_10560 [Spirochaetales bacterium]
MFGRIGDILRSYLQWEEELFYGRDFEEAWEELNRFLHQGVDPLHYRSQSEPLRGYNRRGSSYRRGTSYYRTSASSDPQEHLRQDYANLEVPFKSDMETVKKQYKILLRKYHPDHFAQDPEQYQNATEVTKKLNESYQRIKEYHEHRS